MIEIIYESKVLSLILYWQPCIANIWKSTVSCEALCTSGVIIHTLSVKGQMLNILVFVSHVVSTFFFTILYKGKTILSFWTKLIWPVGHSYFWCKCQALCWIILISLCEPVLVLGTEKLMIIYDRIQVTWMKMCEYAFKLWRCLKT